MGLIRSLLDALGRSRSRKKIRQQFTQAGFKEVECPPISDLLPLRYRDIVRDDHVSMFEKGDMLMLVVPLMLMPRTRIPHRGKTFVLMCTSLGSEVATIKISGALRAACERYSIVDQLDLDTYPSLSPLPKYTLLAANRSSAQQLLKVVTLKDQSEQSLIVHNGRLFAQVSS